MAQPGTELAEGTTFWGLLQRRVELSPDRLMFVDEQDRRVTFAEFAARAERVAAGLYALGISADTPVSWQLPTRIDTIVLSMALSRLGARQNPIIALYREREVASLLRSTGAAWLVVPQVWRGFDYLAMAEQLAAAAERPCAVLDADLPLPEGDPSTLPPDPSDPDAERWLYTTSGTTSEPKAVRHTDGTLIAGGIGIAGALALTPDDVGCVPFPYAHIGGPDNLVMQLRSGYPILLLETFVPEAAVRLMREHGCTMIGGSTAHYLALLQEQRKAVAAGSDELVIPTLRILAGGGAPKPPELYWQVRDELHAQIRHGYGMTECPMIANGSATDTDEELANTDGRPVPGCEVRIIDAAGNPVPAGTAGDIVVGGPMLTKGYTDAALNAESFLPDGFFRTGDRGHVRETGHVVLTGRSKEIIIRKGENIAPREIEDLLMTHPSVGAVAVIGLPDPDRGERICAVVELRPGAAPITLGDVQTLCREAGLMIQKTPEQLELVEALPRNPTMKVLKRELLERFADQRATAT